MLDNTSHNYFCPMQVNIGFEIINGNEIKIFKFFVSLDFQLFCCYSIASIVNILLTSTCVEPPYNDFFSINQTAVT